MSDLKNLIPDVIRRKQYLLFAVITLAVTILVMLVLFLDQNKSSDEINKLAEQKSEKRIQISKVASGAKAEDRWIIQAESELKKISQGLDNQNANNEQLQAKIRELEETIKIQEEEQKGIDSLAAELGQLKEELDNLKENQSNNTNNLETSQTLGQLEQRVNLGDSRKIQHYDLGLSGSRGKIQTYDLKNYLPPVSYVPAVVIESADVSVGVNAQGDPRNMTFRIVGKARTAAFEGKAQEIDISGCTVNGAVVGDLSSERGYIRLIYMTCSREEGKVFVTKAMGHVSSIGKAGIRGDVVSREGDFIFKSFLAGIASGAGGGISQKFASPISLTSGLATERFNTPDIIRGGLGKGISSSSDRLSEYLIQRAEQYQPVISLPVGIEVELMFTEGVYLDGRGGHEKGGLDDKNH